MSRGDEALLPLSIAHQRRYLQALVERIDQWLRTHRS